MQETKQSQQFVRVAFPQIRAVVIDGLSIGKVGDILTVAPGQHVVTLDPSDGVSPREQNVAVKDTTAIQPLIIRFELLVDRDRISVAATRKGSRAAQRSAQQKPDGARSGEEDASDVPADVVPISRAKATKMSVAIRATLDIAHETAGGSGRPIDSDVMLFALAESGWRNPSFHNSAQLLAQTISAGSERMRAQLDERWEKQRGGWQSTRAPEYLTAAAWGLIESALGIMLKVSTREKFLSARHLLAAILAAPAEQPPDGALALLTAIDVHLDGLRERFRAAVVANPDPDNPEAWRRLPLRPVLERPVISRFNADLSSGDDKLGIRADVNAMANLMASRALEPPLSIGLFGDWGSGKSFFIGKLEDAVRQLSERARDGQPGYRESYWPKIVQVKFNAWHFVDANLWASLVSHVFEELNRWGQDEEPPIQAAKAKALETLRVAAEARAAAQARLDQAEQSRAEAVRVREQRIHAFDANRLELAKAVGKDVWQEVDAVLQRVAPEERKHLRALGIAAGDTLGSTERVYSQLSELRTLAGRIYAAGTLMVTSGAWKAALGVFLALTVGVLVLAYNVPDMRTLIGLVGQTTAAVTAAALWFGRSAARVSQSLEPLGRLHGKLEAELKKAEKGKAEEVSRLEKAVQRLQADCAEATKNLDQAERNVQTAHAELEATETGRLITRFIEQRASSADYRKHLGIVALIRDDFHRLSALIKDYNDSRLKPAKAGAPSPQDLGINRIILYIDDLDRCPADRVVEVLQAIHLLLAFPLFVVVVAVDARWVSTSLQEQYRGMLVDRRNGRPSTGNEHEHSAPASPRDYLEKIFQVPFWVQPMVPDGCRSLLGELLKYDQAAQPQTAAVGGPPGRAAETPKGDGGKQPPTSQPSPRAASPVEASPERLQIEAVEAAAMTELSAIIGRSPRATKCFVNVYRLIKAALPAEQLDMFVGSREQPGEFRAPMLLLAATAGLPKLASRVMRAISAEQGATGKATKVRRAGTVLEEILREVDPGGGDEFAEEKRRLRAFLALADSKAWKGLPLTKLQEWSKRVGQFTFDAR